MHSIKAFFAFRQASSFSWKTKISLVLWLIIAYLTLAEAKPVAYRQGQNIVKREIVP